MRKYFTGAIALALVAAMMTGCGRRNVSNNTDGMITDPATTAATMPSTDTAPIATTQPQTSTGETILPGNGDPTNETEHTNATEQTNGTDQGGSTTESGMTEGRARHANPRSPRTID